MRIRNQLDCRTSYLQQRSPAEPPFVRSRAVACRLGFAATACSSFRSVIAIRFDFCTSRDFVPQVVLHFLWPDFLQGFALLCYRSEKVRVISEIGNVFNPFGKIGH